MIFQLRKDRSTVCDIEVTTPKEDGRQYIELHASVFVAGYSRIILKHADEALKVVKDFEEVEEMRGWLWENYFGGKQNIYNIEDYNNVVNHVKTTLKRLAHEYDLQYVED